MNQKPRKLGEVFWPKVVLKKWLNMSGKDSDFSADEPDNESEFDEEENCEDDEEKRQLGGLQDDIVDKHFESIPYKSRRRNSETLRAQYINTKELRICIGTWNVGGRVPKNDLDIAEWLDMEKPSDIYVLGFQEIVPLNAGNVFGAEDSRPVQKWENIIRQTLNKAPPSKPKYKCYSAPSSPSRFNPSEDIIAAADELLPETDSDSDEDEDEDPFSLATISEGCTMPDDSSSCGSAADSSSPRQKTLQRNWSITSKRLDRLNPFSLTEDDQIKLEASGTQQKVLLKTLSRSERVGLVWPEQPLDLLAKHPLNNWNSFKSSRSFRACKSFRPARAEVNGTGDDLVLVPDLDLDYIANKKRRPPFVRIISKQMVGIFLTIWVRQGLRKYIQNLKVSTVGVGAMGYIGNKGSISVSMSIYQTLFCFVCSHLSSGDKSADVLKRNADVQEVHRRTHFASVAAVGLPKTIHDHERIFWLGDLNYRIDLPYERTHELISTKDWSRLSDKDQLKRELRKGRAFDGWTEGILKFPPTYKYEFNSEKYIGDDQKGGRRSPAWCDRILSFGKDIKLMNYKRAELKLSDHRPVAASFTSEVEVFSHRKLQRALTLTDAEIEDGEVVPDLDFGFSITISNDVSKWSR